MDDPIFAPAHEMAKAIQRGEVSSMEVVDSDLGQITRHNPQLNAVVSLDEEGARGRAVEADTALAGERYGAQGNSTLGCVNSAAPSSGGRKPLFTWLPGS